MKNSFLMIILFLLPVPCGAAIFLITGSPVEGISTVNGLPTGLSPKTLSIKFKTTDGSGNLIGYGANTPKGGFFLQIIGSKLAVTDRSMEISSGPVVNDGKFHSAICSYNGTTQTVYLDGFVVFTTSWPYSNAASNTLYIGSDNRGPIRNINVTVEDARIYAAEVTPNEARSIAAGSHPNTTTLLSWFRFNELKINYTAVSGSIFLDSSPRHKNCGLFETVNNAVGAANAFTEP